MAQESPLSATGALTEEQYEWLAAPNQADGLIGHPDDPSPCYASGGQIMVRANLRGVVRGFPWGSGTTDYAHVPDLTTDRTDVIALRLDRPNSYAVQTVVRVGSSGSGAPSPYTGTNSTDLYEIPLAEYDIKGGVITAVRTRAWYLGEDGQILVKNGIRPPHNPGRRIRETDTGITWESTGLAWVKNLDDSGIAQATINSGWVANANYLQRRNGIVVWGFKITRTGAAIAAGTQTTFGSIPSGFRPSFDVENAVLYWSGDQPMNVKVFKTGQVDALPGAGMGISQNRAFQGQVVWHAA